jgi:hypothetical protein
MTYIKITNRLVAVMAVATLMLSFSVNAATIYLVPGTTTMTVGMTYQVELWTEAFGATANTSGGGVDAFYDSTVFDFLSWTDTSGTVFGSPGLPQDLVGEVNAIQVDTADFLNPLPDAALQSGILEFAVLAGAALGTTSMTLAENDIPLGGFFSQVPITFTGATFNIIDAAPVPLPGGLLLLGSAFGLMGFARRRGTQR